MGDARRFLQLPGTFNMRHGAVIRPQVAYETWGELNTNRDNAILIFTGLSPPAHAASNPQDSSPGWWEDMIGPNKPIDTNRFFVVCTNSLGSCFGSTGPASINPQTNDLYRMEFPVLTLEDIATAAKHVVDELDLERLHTVLGVSMGGMSALAFAVQFPGYANSLLSISSALTCRPFAIALRSLQRELILKDPNWNNGNYTPDKYPILGLQTARKLGMITYRSAEEWRTRFGRERVTENRNPFGIDFEVESYLEAHAQKFSGTFDPNCYLYLSRAMDLFDIADHGGSVASAMQGLNLKRALVVGVRSDFLFPLEQQEELAVALSNADIAVDFRQLNSIQGHDSFLVDMENFRPVVAEYFNN